MIISNSDVSLASQREFSRRTGMKSTTLGRQSGDNAQFIIFSNQSTSVTEKESYMSTGLSPDNSDSYEPDSYHYPVLYFPTSTYNPDGLFNDYDIPKGETRMDAIEKACKNPVKGLKGGDLFDEVTTKVYRSLLDFIRNMQLRGFFYNPDYKSMQKSSDSKTLRITTSQKPSVWNVSHNDTYYMSEKECTSFQGNGYATTSDGRELQFNIDVTMSREYMEETEIEYIGQYQNIFTDPLVINLDSAPAEITDQKFMFDLDSDGEPEEIARMNSSSGYLALDLNEDGVINDGSELFGTRTGNGFKELSEYDDDNNGWIDENDSVYSKLKVWVKEEAGNDRLLDLKQADVGAIYLGSSKTRFALTDDSNNAMGMVRSTGIFLHESGEAGTIQQIDF
ncbi:MAG: hypothetical protein ACI4E1_02310 [Lachnospira sp.]